MSKTLSISDDLYKRLEHAARQKGLKIEQLLDTWQASEDDLSKRQRAAERIDDLRGKLFRTYGEMLNSVDSIREDRDR